MQRIQQVYAHRSSLIGIQCPVIWTICHDSVTNSVCNMDRLHIHLIFHAMIIHLSCNPVHEFSLISINLSRTAGLTSKKFKKGYSPVATCQSLVQLMGERAQECCQLTRARKCISFGEWVLPMGVLSMGFTQKKKQGTETVPLGQSDSLPQGYYFNVRTKFDQVSHPDREPPDNV